MDLYTRCPHCQTVFRLVAEQLDAAGGRVRCGACLRVFPARNYLVRPKTASTPTRTASTPAPAAPRNQTPPEVPSAAPKVAKPAKVAPPTPAAPELNFDSFFTPAPATAPAQPAERSPAPAPTPIRTAPTPAGQPDAPDFSLLSAALTEVGQLRTPAETDPVAEVNAQTETASDVEVTHETPAPISHDPPHSIDVPPTEPEAELDADFGLIDSLPMASEDSDSHDELALPDWQAPRSPTALQSPPAQTESASAQPIVDTPAIAPRHDQDVGTDDIATAFAAANDDRPTDDTPLELELPDDWASLKPKTRTEPVFDDDNGLLDSELDAVSPSRPPSPKPAGRQNPKHSSDGLDWLRDDDASSHHPITPRVAADAKPAAEPVKPKPVEASRPIATTQAPLASPAPASTPAVLTSLETPAPTPAEPPMPPEPISKVPEVITAAEEDFEWNLDAVEAATAEPSVFGDWQPDQGDTVKLADDDDQLIPVRKQTTPAPQATTPNTEPAPRPAGKARAQAGDPDLGEISSDWEQPPVAIHAEDVTPPVASKARKASKTASTEPQPFDHDAFTADPADRIYAPADAGDDSDDWTLSATEIPHDYEAELYAQPKRKFPWRGVLGTLAAVLLLTVLVTQLLWPQRAALREDPQWGPWVEQLCGYIECNLPPRTDLRKIELQQRSVLKDRDDPRKLQIDLLIANKAAFAQPYPDINLRFTNIEGELVAERRFKPSEYLREAPDSAEMPIGVPVHIAFSVKAPDGNITGYEFNFLPPQ